MLNKPDILKQSICVLISQLRTWRDILSAGTIQQTPFFNSAYPICLHFSLATTIFVSVLWVLHNPMHALRNSSDPDRTLLSVYGHTVITVTLNYPKVRLTLVTICTLRSQLTTKECFSDVEYLSVTAKSRGNRIMYSWCNIMMSVMMHSCQQRTPSPEYKLSFPVSWSLPVVLSLVYKLDTVRIIKVTVMLQGLDHTFYCVSSEPLFPAWCFDLRAGILAALWIFPWPW